MDGRRPMHPTTIHSYCHGCIASKKYPTQMRQNTCLGETVKTLFQILALFIACCLRLGELTLILKRIVPFPQFYSYLISDIAIKCNLIRLLRSKNLKKKHQIDFVISGESKNYSYLAFCNHNRSQHLVNPHNRQNHIFIAR